MQLPFRFPFIRPLALSMSLLSGLAAQAAPLDDMVAFDATYIPALAMSTQASQDAAAAPKAQATLGALRSRWPALKQSLATTWGDKLPNGWPATLASVEAHISAALAAASASDWKRTHEALEPVRIDLMQARQCQGMDYFVDRLSAFHAPMEVLALAGTTLQPNQLDAARHAELEKAYSQARVLWRAVEQAPVDPAAYRLSEARRTQLHSAIEAETAALGRLSDALRGSDAAALLKAAAAIKPPYARAFTAFGQNEAAQVH